MPYIRSVAAFAVNGDTVLDHDRLIYRHAAQKLHGLAVHSSFNCRLHRGVLDLTHLCDILVFIGQSGHFDLCGFTGLGLGDRQVLLGDDAVPIRLRLGTVLSSAAFTIISCAVHSFNSMAVFFRPLQYFAPTNPPDFVIFPSSTDSKVRWEISQSSNLNVCPAAPFDIVLPITPPAAVFALITVFFTTHSVKLLSP